jgi:sugar (pentulose or hexulose) kinase
MEKHIISLDLGTTNVKVALYNSKLEEIDVHSRKVKYSVKGDFVEFDPESYWVICAENIKSSIKSTGIDPGSIVSLSVTGQAESLVLLDSKHRPLRMAISWMDERSKEECKILGSSFEREEVYMVTGLPEMITTAPISKILWIKRNEPEVFKRARKFLLIKDFILYKLTRRFISEYSTYSFSYYFDIVKKRYWQDILDFVNVSTDQLPQLIEAGETAGRVSREIAEEFNFSETAEVNTGALDHFAGMIGVGNVKEGILSETTGTVLAMAMLTKAPQINEFSQPCHCSALKNRYVLLPVCESGGASLEWFRQNFYNDISYENLNRKIEKVKSTESDLIFLPYITGANSPELDSGARGVFYGIRSRHGRADFARSVMEGITFLLRKNVEYLEKMGMRVENIISLGGGSKSALWNQMKADIIGKDILIPANKEAASFGAAILSAVKSGFYKDVYEAVDKLICIKDIYSPASVGFYEKNYKKFLSIYDNLTSVFRG